MRMTLWVEIFCLIQLVNGHSITQEVANFCVKQSCNFITWTGLPHGMTQINSKLGIRTRVLPLENYELMENFDTWVVHDLGPNIPEILQIAQKRRIQRSILVTPESQLDLVKKHADDLAQNAFIYLLTYENENYKWRQIITMNNSTMAIFNDIQFDELSGRMIENYNLQGYEIVVTSLSWAPYHSHKNCNALGRRCENYGLLADLMNIWALDYNFTWDVYHDLNNDWGLNPKSGPYNLSGEWSGVMGDVVSGKYPMSLNAWNWIIERNYFLDFVPVIKDNQVLAVVPSPPEVDPGLFIRPFRDDTWKGIGGMILLGILMGIVPWVFVRYYHSTTSFNLVVTSGWFFFVLINAYYGGALTMFFVSEITLPFNTIRDALKVFPSWKIMIQDGNDAYFQLPAAQGDSDFIKYWQEVENERGQYVVPDLMSGVEMLDEGQIILHAMEGMLRGAYKANPHMFPNLKTFGATRSKYFAIGN